MYMSGNGSPLGMSPLVNTYARLVDISGTVLDEARNILLNSHLVKQPGLEVEYLGSVVKAADEPTAQYLFIPSQLSVPPEPKNLKECLMPIHPENYITVITALNHPFARGSVHITSPDISIKPQWDPKLTTHPLDMEILARHLQFVQKFVDTAPFTAVLKYGGKRLPDIIGDDLDSAEDIVRERQMSIYHPSGSLAMLPKEQGGVVNERLIFRYGLSLLYQRKQEVIHLFGR